MESKASIAGVGADRESARGAQPVVSRNSVCLQPLKKAFNESQQIYRNLLKFIEYLVDFARFCIPQCIPGWIFRASRPPLGRVASALRADEVIFESADNQIFPSRYVSPTGSSLVHAVGGFSDARVAPNNFHFPLIFIKMH